MIAGLFPDVVRRIRSLPSSRQESRSDGGVQFEHVLAMLDQYVAVLLHDVVVILLLVDVFVDLGWVLAGIDRKRCHGP